MSVVEQFSLERVVLYNNNQELIDTQKIFGVDDVIFFIFYSCTDNSVLMAVDKSNQFCVMSDLGFEEMGVIIKEIKSVQMAVRNKISTSKYMWQWKSLGREIDSRLDTAISPTYKPQLASSTQFTLLLFLRFLFVLFLFSWWWPRQMG